MRLLTDTEFQTPKGRRQAWRTLFLSDHGVLRKLYDNTHQLGDNAWRSYQPSPRDVHVWATKGIRTIVNLRGRRRGEAQPGFYHLEREAAHQAGMAFIDYRAFSREAPDQEFILGLDTLFDTIQYPVLFHCKSGADRAGIVSVLYLFLKENRPLPEALEQLSLTYGHIRHGKTGILDHFFTTYQNAAKAAQATPSKERFLQWTRESYDKKSVQESFKPTMPGSFLTETILRRE